MPCHQFNATVPRRRYQRGGGAESSLKHLHFFVIQNRSSSGSPLSWREASIPNSNPGLAETIAVSNISRRQRAGLPVVSKSWQIALRMVFMRGNSIFYVIGVVVVIVFVLKLVGLW
jgi:hypothetical protein